MSDIEGRDICHSSMLSIVPPTLSYHTHCRSAGMFAESTRHSRPGPLVEEPYSGVSGIAMLRHMWATALLSFPSPSLGCLN